MNCPNCRAAVPGGSRFCNVCGAAMPVAAPPPQPAQPYRTQMPHGAPAAPRPGMPPSYPAQPNVTQGYAVPPPPAAPNKKPVLLLSALIILICAVVGTASVMLWKRSGQSVVGGKTSVVPNGPGVQQALNPGAPPGPGVVVNGNQVPVPGAPVMANGKNPDGVAPNPLLSTGGRAPNAPGVTTVQTPTLPNAPSPVAVVPTPARPSAPLIGQQQNPGMPQPAPPRPPDNSDFDRYLRWLQFVENERAGLRAQGETESFRVIDSFYQAMLGLADPDANDAQLQRQFDAGIQQTLNRALMAARQFRVNILRTKPPVPSDCKALDNYYMRAVDLEAQQTVVLMDALARKDIGRVKSIGRSGVAQVDTNLGMANKALEEVYRQRGLNQQFRIQTGGNSSMLGGMIGLGGL
jgi:hypothetical protein